MPYSYNNQYPIDILPNRIRLSNGSTRTDSSTFTTDELTDAGYVAVSTAPTYNEKTHKLTWSGSDWETVGLTTAEITNNTEAQWEEVRIDRQNRFNDVDWRVMRYQSEVRLGVTTTTDTIADLDTYLKSLRDITNQSDPYNINWPAEFSAIPDDSHSDPE